MFSLFQFPTSRRVLDEEKVSAYEIRAKCQIELRLPRRTSGHQQQEHTLLVLKFSISKMCNSTANY